jgi:hypothetical protein
MIKANSILIWLNYFENVLKIYNSQLVKIICEHQIFSTFSK